MNRRTKTDSSALNQYLVEINRVALLTVDEERRLAHAFRNTETGGQATGSSRPTCASW